MQCRCSGLVLSSLASFIQDSATECPSTMQLSMCHELTSIKVSSNISSLLGVPGCRDWPLPPPVVAPLPPTPAPADVLGILSSPCGCPKADLDMVAAMPGTVTSMVLRGRCRSPATAWGATPTDRSPVPLHNLHWLASVYDESMCVSMPVPIRNAALSNVWRHREPRMFLCICLDAVGLCEVSWGV